MNTDIISIIAGGDINFDYQQKTKTFESTLKKRDKIFDLIQNSLNIIFRSSFPLYNIVNQNNNNTGYFNFRFRNIKEKIDYPFKNLKKVLLESDLNIFNLESPLTKRKPYFDIFNADPVFVRSLSQNNIRLVTFSNNHSFDMDKEGFLETLSTLRKYKINYIGAGKNLDEARKPFIFQKENTTICFLSYFQNSAMDINRVAAGINKPGIVPLCEEIMKDDIIKSKRISDLVFISLHWEMENTSRIHPEAIKLAHRLIDWGADGILGHHAHVPKGIEIYHNKPIFYSFGNLLFGCYSNKIWGNNFITKIFIKNKKIHKIQIMPTTGIGRQLFSPSLLNARDSLKFITNLKKYSQQFQTKIEKDGNQFFLKII